MTVEIGAEFFRVRLDRESSCGRRARCLDWQMKIIAVEADRLIELAVDDAGLRAESEVIGREDPGGDRGSSNRRRPRPGEFVIPACRGFDDQSETVSRRRPGGSGPAARTAQGTDAGAIRPVPEPGEAHRDEGLRAGGARGRPLTDRGALPEEGRGRALGGRP